MKAVAASFASLLIAVAATASKPDRVVILGFDGVDAGIVEQMMAAGRLPHLTGLKRRGGYSQLTPTVPAQTPVSWATFSTGLDPGGHEIFDFLKRNPADRVPTFAVADEVEKPLFLGRATGPVLGTAVFLFLGLVALLVARRWRVAGVALAVLGLAAGAGVFLAVRAYIPPTRPSVENKRKGKTFWSEAGARPATVMRV